MSIWIRKLFDDASVNFNDSRVSFDGLFEVIGEVVTEGTGAGLQKPRKRPSTYKKFILTFDVIGFKRFVKLFEYTISGIVKKLLEKQIETLAIVKTIIDYKHNLLGVLKETTIQSIILSATRKDSYKIDKGVEGTRFETFLTEEVVTGNRKEFYNQVKLTVANLAILLEQKFRVGRKIEINKQPLVKGNLKVRSEQNRLIKGKKDISNILESLELFD